MGALGAVADGHARGLGAKALGPPRARAARRGDPTSSSAPARCVLIGNGTSLKHLRSCNQRTRLGGWGGLLIA